MPDHRRATSLPDEAPRIGVSEIDPEKIAASVWRRLDERPLAMLPEAWERGPLANLRATGWASGEDGDPPPYEVRDGVAVMGIDGVLFQRAFSMCGFELAAGYDTILQRAAAAFADMTVEAVLLRIDSPGGDVAGMLEAATLLRALADDSGVPLIAYADEMAASAAYALAAAADKIYVPRSGLVGSIGVISTAVNVSGALEASGQRAIVAASPKGKALNHPLLPPQDAGVARMQARVEAAAQLFAEHVAGRRGLTIDQIMALDAGVFMGAAAVEKGLADGVASFSGAYGEASMRRKKRGNIMGVESDRRAGAAMLALLALGGMKLEAGVKEAPPEELEKAATETKRLAEIGRELEAKTGQKGAAALELVSTWQEGHARVAGLEQRVKVERLRGRDADKYPPAEKFALDSSGVPSPAAGVHERFDSMSLAAFEARLDAALPHTATSGPPAAPAVNGRAISEEERAWCKANGVSEDVYLRSVATIGGAQ